MDQWRAAAVGDENTRWVVHCPPKLAEQFAGLEVQTHDRLDLTASLRSRRAEQLHQWVALLLEGSLALAARLAIQIHAERFALYLTRDLDEAKGFASSLYEDAPERTYGLVASSHAKGLPKFGIDNSYLATSRMNVAAWFNAPRGDARASTALMQPVTEFGCQGLELDLPIVCWGEDFRWDGMAWKLTPIRRRIAQRDPYQLLRNAYRVLLTRGRDGLVIFIPPESRLDATETALLAAGVRPLPRAEELAASG
jgi:hypothetical protein